MFGSTTFEWRKVRISPAPAGDRAAQQLRPGFRGVRRRDAHLPMQLEVRYVGGPECGWLISARGRVWRFQGYLQLHDVLGQVAGADG